MNKQAIIDAYAELHNMTKKQAHEEIDRFTEFVSKELETHNTLKFVGFGTFGTKTAPPRTVVSPLTAEPIELPERCLPYFKISQALKDRVLA